MKTLWIIAAFIQLMPFSALGAGVSMCAEPVTHDEMVKVLTGKYNESRTGIGIAAQVIVIETFQSKAGTFTIIATTPDHNSCIIAAGQGWSDVAHEPMGMKS